MQPWVSVVRVLRQVAFLLRGVGAARLSALERPFVGVHALRVLRQAAFLLRGVGAARLSALRRLRSGSLNDRLFGK